MLHVTWLLSRVSPEAHEGDGGDVHPSKPRGCVRSRDGVGCHEEGSCQEVLSLLIPSVNTPHALSDGDEFVHSVSRHHSNDEVQQTGSRGWRDG